MTGRVMTHCLDLTSIGQLAGARHLFWTVLNSRTCSSGQIQRRQNTESTASDATAEATAAASPVATPSRRLTCKFRNYILLSYKHNKMTEYRVDVTYIKILKNRPGAP